MPCALVPVIVGTEKLHLVAHSGAGRGQGGGDRLGGGQRGQPQGSTGRSKGGRRVLSALPQVHALRAPRLDARAVRCVPSARPPKLAGICAVPNLARPGAAAKIGLNLCCAKSGAARGRR